MFKIDRIKVRIRGGHFAPNDHTAINLARAIGESLAEQKVDRNAAIEGIRVLHHEPAATHTDTLAHGISRQIMNQLRKL